VSVVIGDAARAFYNQFMQVLTAVAHRIYGIRLRVYGQTLLEQGACVTCSQDRARARVWDCT
jgi:hypothetical protein